MTFWILAGLIAACVAAWIIAPLGQESRRLASLLTILIPIFTLGLYLLIGNSSLAN